MDLVLYALPVYLPFYQALLVDGIARAVVFLVLALLLMFLMAHKADISRALASCLNALCVSWAAPAPARRFGGLAFATLAIPRGPSLNALFQRPPPLFA
jgi:hypothetical protein